MSSGQGWLPVLLNQTWVCLPCQPADPGLWWRTVQHLCCKAPDTESGAASAQKTWTPRWFGGNSFYRQNLGEVCMVCDLPLIDWWGVAGWCSRSLSRWPSGSNPSGVPVLVLSLKSPSSTGRGPSSCRRALRHASGWVPWGGTGPCPFPALLFLTAPPLLLHSLTPLISNCWNLPFGTQERSRRLKPFSCK